MLSMKQINEETKFKTAKSRSPSQNKSPKLG